MAFRGCIPDFQIANPLYIGATVSFYTVDSNGHATQTLANLFIDPTSSTPALNPQTLDSEGKFASPVYIEVPVIAVVTGPNVASHSTGVINARGTWRGSWVTNTVYYSTDFIQDPASMNVYSAALDYTSGASLAADVTAGNLILVLSVASIVGSTAVKQACLVATTANITLSGLQTVDGVALAAGERVLVKNQTTASQNGIYVVASGAWVPASDFATGQVYSGLQVFITTGTVNALTTWELTTADPITVGTTSLAFSANRVDIGTRTVSGTLNVIGTFESNGTAQTFPASGNLAGTSDTQTLTNKTFSGGTLSGTIAGTPTLSGANFLSNANLAQGGAYTIKGNPTGATANEQDFTIPGLTLKASPVSADLILLADSAASNALKQTTVGDLLAGAASAMALLNTLTASNSASLSDTTSLTSSYSSYLIVLENLIPATNNVTAELELHSDGSFQTGSGSYTYANGGESSGGSTVSNTGTGASLNLTVATAVYDGNSGLSGVIHIFTPSQTASYKLLTWDLTYWDSSTVLHRIFGSGSWTGGTTAIDGLQFLFSSGNITSGAIKIYGIQ